MASKTLKTIGEIGKGVLQGLAANTPSAGTGNNDAISGIIGNIVPRLMNRALEKARGETDEEKKRYQGMQMRRSEGMASPSSYAKGGVVKKTGMAKVHKGEHVLTPAKAGIMLREGSVRGHKLTEKQRGFFGAVYSSGVSSGRKKTAGSLLSSRR